jgi:hypothetical protein
MAPLILTVGTRRGHVATNTIQPLYRSNSPIHDDMWGRGLRYSSTHSQPRSLYTWYPLNMKLGGPQSRPGSSGQQRSPLSLSGIEPRILSCPVPSTVNISTELSRLQQMSLTAQRGRPDVTCSNPVKGKDVYLHYKRSLPKLTK